MPLSHQRIHWGNTSDFAFERDAISFVTQKLVDIDPYHAWPLHDLFTDNGRIYEIDLMILGKHALYLVEIKSHPGRVEGDTRDWVIRDGARRWVMANPMGLTNHKAKILKSMLTDRLGAKDASKLWVEPLIFLSHPTIDVALDEDARIGVLTRRTIERAITHGDIGLNQPTQRGPISKPLAEAVVKAMGKLGLRPSAASRIVSNLKLGELLGEGPGYQEFSATNTNNASLRKRVCCYQLSTTVQPQDRDRLRKLAGNALDTLQKLGEHPCLLRCENFVDQHDIGVCLIFQDFEDAQTLDTFLRQNPDLPFSDRLQILRLLVETLTFCHRQHVIHRNLNPHAVLVRRRADQSLEVKLHRFHVAVHADATTVASSHIDDITDESFRAYQAPELYTDPSRASVKCDVFGVGALAFLLFTGQAPKIDISRPQDASGYHPALVNDGLSPDLNTYIAQATHPSPRTRPERLIDWFNDVLKLLTVSDHADVDPYNASIGHQLKLPDGKGTLTVTAVLGAGATSRVFEVRDQKDRTFALKIARDDASAKRLATEAQVLASLSHPFIIHLVQALDIQGRACLLLEAASNQTLLGALDAYGTLNLDEAHRLGDQIMDALAFLESKGILHCDIKPANIGFDTDNTNLRLLDFSLAGTPPINVNSGTPVYRDPALRSLASWDHAGDRFCVAHVLYECLTSCRLTPEDLPGSLQGNVTQEILRDADRFDPSIRDQLIQFFMVALHSDRAQRFPSIADMRAAWNAAFRTTHVRIARPPSLHPGRAPSVHPVLPSPAAPPDESKPFSPVAPDVAAWDLDLSHVTLETPLSALPASCLDLRALNVLDRARVQTVAHLLDLSDTDLNGLRGLGARLIDEISNLSDRLRDKLSPAPADPLVPNFQGIPQPLVVGVLGLDASDLRKLHEAGIHTTFALASSPAAHIGRLLGDPQASSKRRRPDAIAQDLAKRLRIVSDAPTSAPHAPDFNLWISQLLKPRGGSSSNESLMLRALLGLVDLPPLPSSIKIKDKFKRDDPPRGFAQVRDVELRFNTGKRLLEGHLKAASDKWLKHKDVPSLLASISQVLQSFGGIASLQEVVAAFLDRYAPPASAAGLSIQAHALLRIAAEVGQRQGSLYYRLHGPTVWFSLDDASFDVLAALGDTADELAAQPTLPTPATAYDRLRPLVADSSLSRLSVERLLQVAAHASSLSRLSLRQELYPVGLAPARTLRCLAPHLLLQERFRDADLRALVSQRFPDAAPLPDVTALKSLLSDIGPWSYDPPSAAFIRAPSPAAPSTEAATRSADNPPASPISVHGPRAPSRPPFIPPDASPELRAFNDQIRAALESGRFRALLVDADHAERAADRLAAFLQIEPISLDHLLLRHLRADAESRGITPKAIFGADRLGPSSPHWSNLCALVANAAKIAINEILKDRTQPRLLAHPGLFARFNLTAHLDALVTRAEHEDGASVFLLVPTHDGSPRINNALPIPTPLAVQRLRVPRAWARAPFPSPEPPPC